MSTFKILTIYEQDWLGYPGKFVVRASLVTIDGPRMMPLPLAVCASLEEARAAIAKREPGLVRMHRMPDDNPAIVETWL